MQQPRIALQAKKQVSSFATCVQCTLSSCLAFDHPQVCFTNVLHLKLPIKLTLHKQLKFIQIYQVSMTHRSFILLCLLKQVVQIGQVDDFCYQKLIAESADVLTLA